MQPLASGQPVQPVFPSSTRLAAISRPGIAAFVPPTTDSRFVVQRADEVNIVRRMLGDAQTSTVVLTGDAGVGKSTLAALVYAQLQADGRGTPFQQFIWLTIGPYTDWPDCLVALMNCMGADAFPADFSFAEPAQQVVLLFNVLSSPQAGLFIVLDQFEDLLNFETAEVLSGRKSILLFLEMLQQDLGSSRVLLTGYRSPFAAHSNDESRVRSYLVSRVSMPEGAGLLQQRGVLGSAPELSLVWQRCAGHAYALVLFSALFALSGFSLSYLLNSPDYQFLWNGDVTLNLTGLVYNFLNPIQRTLLRALSLFSEPAPFEGLLLAITGDGPVADTQAFQRELTTLLHLSIVQQTTGEKYQPCYTLHHLLRLYTTEHYLEGQDRGMNGSPPSAVGVATELNPIAANPETRDIALAAGHMRVASYYQRQARRQCPPRQARQHIRDVEPLLQVISHLCLGCHWQQAYDLLTAEGLHDNLMQWGAVNILIRLYVTMVPPLGIVTRHDEALICSHLGLLYGQLSEQRQSARYYQQALDTQREIQDLHGQAITLINQGELLRGAGNSQLARVNFEQAYQILTQKPETHLQSVLLHNMGLLAQDEKEYEQALQHYLQSLHLARHLNDSYNSGIILTNIGMLLFEQGRLPEALALLSYAWQMRDQAQDPTIDPLVRFLGSLEQKMGPQAFALLRREAQQRQSELLAEIGETA